MKELLWFALGFYVCGAVQAGSLIYLALSADETACEWSSWAKAAVSLAVGVAWPVVVSWLWRKQFDRHR